MRSDRTVLLYAAVICAVLGAAGLVVTWMASDASMAALVGSIVSSVFSVAAAILAGFWYLRGRESVNT
jgi:hypothetical protein